jgi:tetratricopeptide (TPR) repeat protein
VARRVSQQAAATRPAHAGPPREVRGIKQWVWAAIGLALVVAAAFAWQRWSASMLRDALPDPPRVVGTLPAVAEHLQSRAEAARRDPGSIEAVGPFCLALHADMFYDQASACYAHAATIDAGWRWDYARAVIAADRGGGGELAPMLRRVVASAADHGPAWLRLADAEFKAGRYDAAADAWTKARSLSEPARKAIADVPTPVAEIPLASHAALGLARLALVRGDAAAARDVLEPLVAASPGFGAAHRLLADAYRALNREADAERAIYRASRLPPYSPYADPFVDELAHESRNSTFLLRLSSEADLSRNAAWSEWLARRAASFDPENPEVVVKLGRILRTVGRNDEALVHFQRYHRMVPDDVQGWAHLGSCLSALGRFDEAEPYLRRAVAGQDDPISHYNLALLLSTTGRLDEARRSYEVALARDPSHGDARGNLAAVLVQLGRVDEATRQLVTLVDRDPENALARANLGLLLANRGQRQAARVHLAEAVRLNPNLTPAVDALRAIADP